MGFRILVDTNILLAYVDGKLCEDPFVQELEEAVSEARRNREWRHEYMTLMLRDQDNIEKGREEGREEGRAAGREEERKEGIRILVESLKNLGIPAGQIYETVRVKYSLTEEELKKLCPEA